MGNNVATTVELRKKNRRELLKLLISNGVTTRNDLKENSGFSYTTIGNLLGDLQEENFIIQKGEATSTGGRKAQVIKVNPDKAYFLSIDLSGKLYKWGIYNLEGEKIIQESYEYLKVLSPGDNYRKLLVQISDFCKENSIIDNLKYMGVVLSGYYSLERDEVIDSYEDINYKDISIKGRAREFFDIPIIVKNDAKTAAYYESRHFNVDSQLFYILVLKESLGTGIVIDNSVFKGVNGYAGEVYNMTQVYNGKEYTAGDLLHPLSDMKELSHSIGRDIDDEEFFKLYRDGNPEAHSIYQKTVLAFAKVILQVSSVLNPSDIRIGGYYNYYGDTLAKDILNKMMQLGEGWQYNNVSLKLSDFSQYTLIDGIGAQLSNIWLDSLWS